MGGRSSPPPAPQTTELMRKAKAFAQQIYQASWALKDADPISQDYTDDKHWP